jgi:CRISPR/Cas system CSM-associated protein Csm3 (group 7 of RAMP superfamily)
MSRFPTEPKPYDIVLFETSPQIEKPHGHDKWQEGKFTGSLQCRLTILSPVHIGSGLFELANGQVVRGFVKQGNHFVIPGPSLKGVFRSIAEAISASCVSKTRARAKDLPLRGLGECDNPKQLCVCCRLFGSLGYLGRVRFTDAQPVEQTLTTVRVPALYSPRPDARIYRDQRRLYRGRKFYFHGRLSQGQEPLQAVAEGSVFTFRVDFENMTDMELHLLLTAMGAIGGLKPKIGGGKPACLGSVEVALEKTTLHQAKARFLDYTQAQRSFTEEEWQRIRTADTLIRKDALSKLQAILAYPPSRDCPSRPY